MSPLTTTHNSTTNLQDELDGVKDDDSKTISCIEDVEDSDDEEVDWDQLQKTEDAESKDNVSEDVSSIPASGRPGVPIGRSLWLSTTLSAC